MPASKSIVLLLLALLAVAAGDRLPGLSVPAPGSALRLPNGPQSQCSFPRLCQKCIMNAGTIRVAQRLIAAALNATSYTPDGSFTAEFAANITLFQALKYIPDTVGILDETTWRVLADVSTASPSSSAVVIAALQDALVTIGFGVVTNGIWGSDTTAALSAFRASRSLPPPSVPPSTNPRDWLLLVSHCNPSNGSFWFDAGWPQGVMDIVTLACLRYAGFEFATFECWRGRPGQEKLNGWWPQCLRNLANARAAGFRKLGVYMWPQRTLPALPQATQLLRNLRAANAQFTSIMLDIEGSDWSAYNASSNQDFVLSLVSAFADSNVPVAIYCGFFFNNIFGSNFTALNHLPLIYAHYDNIPSYVDFIDNKFGGWGHASGKQFIDGVVGEQVCGSGALDWDWSHEPWW